MSPLRHLKSLTLIELIISLVLMSIIVGAFAMIDSFCYGHLLISMRRAQVQQEASFLVGHITRSIVGSSDRGGAIGDTINPPIAMTTIGGDTTMTVWIDYNGNGRRDASPADRQIAYRYRSAPNYEVWYYPDLTTAPGVYEVITQKKISPDFGNDPAQPTYVLNPSADTLEIQVTACWDPDGNPDACGSPKNPSIRLFSRIRMPSVSAN
ncbi:MAG TPA: prepilin-type N-terminal cleavage/methylation domain-containing protein [Patescibacteria group bacterium]|nr:prepilin-type N-terminal cleavage/methylation domain-containing protein [Patescibacteria group bacterium]